MSNVILQDIENGDQPTESKKKKKPTKTKKEKAKEAQKKTKSKIKETEVTTVDSEMSHFGDKNEEYNTEVVELSDAELEDGECSDSSEDSSEGEESCASTATADSDDGKRNVDSGLPYSQEFLSAGVQRIKSPYSKAFCS